MILEGTLSTQYSLPSASPKTRIHPMCKIHSPHPKVPIAALNLIPKYCQLKKNSKSHHLNHLHQVWVKLCVWSIMGQNSSLSTDL